MPDHMQAANLRRMKDESGLFPVPVKDPSELLHAISGKHAPQINALERRTRIARGHSWERPSRRELLLYHGGERRGTEMKGASHPYIPRAPMFTVVPPRPSSLELK